MKNSQYVRLMQALHYSVRIRINFPVMTLYLLQDAKIKREYTTLLRIVVDMTRVTNNGKITIVQPIKGGVLTVWPFECILNKSHLLINHDMLLELKKRYWLPVNLPANTKSFILWIILPQTTPARTCMSQCFKTIYHAGTILKTLSIIDAHYFMSRLVKKCELCW